MTLGEEEEVRWTDCRGRSHVIGTRRAASGAFISAHHVDGVRQPAPAPPPPPPAAAATDSLASALHELAALRARVRAAALSGRLEELDAV